MGYVYNNPWEAFCKTYLELHGYVVSTNLYAALLAMEEVLDLQHEGLLNSDGNQVDGRRTKIEADMAALRTSVTLERMGRYHFDKPKKDSHPGEFFPGVPDDANNLVYAEVRANLALRQPEQQIAPFFGSRGKEGVKVRRMTDILKHRYGVKPTFVLMGFCIPDEYKDEIAENKPGWKFKEFDPIFTFMRSRMRDKYEKKKQVFYNDPILELMRFLEHPYRTDAAKRNSTRKKSAARKRVT